MTSYEKRVKKLRDHVIKQEKERSKAEAKAKNEALKASSKDEAEK